MKGSTSKLLFVTCTEAWHLLVYKANAQNNSEASNDWNHLTTPRDTSAQMAAATPAASTILLGAGITRLLIGPHSHSNLCQSSTAHRDRDTLSLRSQEPQTEFVDAMKRALVIEGLFFDLYFQLPAGTNDDAAPSF